MRMRGMRDGSSAAVTAESASPGFVKEERTGTATEGFERNRLAGYRYVDKTALLAPLLRGDCESTFFLRPRRFGKTLTLSMIH